MNQTQRARVLDHVFLHEGEKSAHVSETIRLANQATAIKLMEEGHEPATAFELAFDESKHPRKSDGKFAPKGQGEAGSPTDSDDVERAYNVRPGGFLKRDSSGNPISDKVGSLGEYRAAPHMGQDHAERSRARYEAAAKLDPMLDVPTGPEQPGEKLERVTHADTPEIMRTRSAIKAWEAKWRGENGVNDTSELDSPERQAMRSSIIDDLYGNGASKKERKVFLITGPPGSGKSTLVKNQGYLTTHGAIEIDSDMAKEQLPEFNAGRGANLVHEESSKIADSVLRRAMANGDNIVHPIVGKSKEGLMKKIKEFTDAGYSVQVDNLYIEPERSMESVASRFHRNGRFVPPEYAEKVDGHPMTAHNETAEAMKDVPNVSFAAHKSDDVVKIKAADSRQTAFQLAELYD